MKGLETSINKDYSTGPGPRAILTINCNEFDCNFYNNEQETEFVNAVKDVFADVLQFNSKSVSIILQNYDISHIVDEYVDGEVYDYDDMNVDLRCIFKCLYDNFQVTDIWTYTDKDFHWLMSTGVFNDCLSSWSCKADKYFVCGEYKPDHSCIFVEGGVINKFPVTPIYRKSFNQRIWKVDMRVQKDVTHKLDFNYLKWKDEAGKN